MPHTIAERVRKWSRELTLTSFDSTTVNFSLIHNQILYLSEQLFKYYEITKSPPHHHDFFVRLRHWLDCAPEDDQKILFQLVSRLFFIGPDEFLALHRSAYDGPITQWLIEQEGLMLDDFDINKKIMDSLKRTWFCSLTDSMHISTFCHQNQIEGADLRPEFRLLKKFCTPSYIADHMANNHLERIVLLEDFVGTGTQTLEIVEYAAKLPIDVKILVCPLIVCLSGYKAYSDLEKTYRDRVTFSPVLKLDNSSIIYENPLPNEDDFIKELRKTIIKLHDKVKGSDKKNDYGPFGFGAKKEGGGLLVVNYTNCPDNTIPIVHRKSDGPWYPLFSRSTRV